jgi:proteasome lid subunit RPN8/RPN11
MSEKLDMFPGFLEKKLEEQKQKKESLLREFNDALDRCDSIRARLCFENLLRTGYQIEVLDELLSVAGKEKRAGIYVFSSWLLENALSYLVADEKENFLFVTGVETCGKFIPTRLVPVKPENRSVVRFTSDIGSTFRQLIEMDNRGHRLIAHFHSHPGTGELSAEPSDIDFDDQESLERGGYPAVGAVFNRDGYVHFYSKKRKFGIEIFGKGVRNEHGNVYRIVKAGQDSDEAGEDTGGLRRGGRQAAEGSGIQPGKNGVVIGFFDRYWRTVH